MDLFNDRLMQVNFVQQLQRLVTSGFDLMPEAKSAYPDLASESRLPSVNQFRAEVRAEMFDYFEAFRT